MAVTVILAFLAGALTVLSPCTLPIVPVVLAVGGSGGRVRLAGLLAGFAAVFLVTTVLAAAALSAAGLTTTGLRAIAILGLGLAGVALAVPAVGARLAIPVRGSRVVGVAAGRTGRRRQLATGLALGAATGLVWAPCTGPVMAGVIVSAATLGPGPEAVVVALAYVLGAAVPLAVIGLAGGRAIRRMGSAAARAWAVRSLGVLLIVAAVAVGTGLDLRLGAALGAGPDLASALDPAPAGEPATPASDTDPTVDGDAVPGTADQLPPPLASSLPASVLLQDLGPAPELAGITAWLNSDPVSLAALRGKVVVVEFWTFACINCIHVEPYVKAWDARYRDAGLVVLGVHTPELSFERDLGNVRRAVADAGIGFPVAFDPDYRTWRAFGNHVWPALYFVDRAGRIRHVQLGEGGYDTSEQIIRQLLRT